MARVTGHLFVELLTDPKNFHSFHLSILCVCVVCVHVYGCVCMSVYTHLGVTLPQAPVHLVPHDSVFHGLGPCQLG